MESANPQMMQMIKGTCLLSVLIALGAWALGYGQAPFYIGLGVGSVFSLLLFALLARTVEIAVTLSPPKAQRYMAMQYFGRMGLTGLVITIAIMVDFINPLGVMLPLFYPKLILYSTHLFGKEAKKANERS